MSESKESSMPPLPGRILPLSLTPAALLNVDSMRSPAQEKSDAQMPNAAPTIGE